MATITIFGQGNMGQAIAGVFQAGGHSVDFAGKEGPRGELGQVVVLAVPYGAVAGIVTANKEALKGKIIVDISNPVNFETMDELLVPAGTSAAEELAKLLPEARIVKAFNTNFAATLASQKVAEEVPAVVELASDDEEAKGHLAAYIQAGGLQTVDAGALKRARELEAMGFLQITLAMREEISWTAGFALMK
ncbi:NADPH-dependent F420 reductase [Streptococcus panodentis]|uniref:Diguanylate cyclase n=1 Tax=Streptococcus panodentis TaxID=1581472 RepID=A0ABS5AZ03_9STRE|nr:MULTISPECIES: NADPH-dependent F420 reductase [Streptococcus]KXT85310.1 oxidoreductase [Streptococcus sp. DD11]MBP2621812.1 diguanylate cyclase [Streptococcus panodentis]